MLSGRGTLLSAASPFTGDRTVLDDQTLAELTRRFYEKADLDPVIGPVIQAALPVERRAEHFAVFRDFWAKMLFGTEGYGGNAFTAHAGMVLEARHFERWLEIFAELAEEMLPPDIAARALAQARHMSQCLQGKPGDHHAERSVAVPLGRAVKGKPRLAVAKSGGGCGCGSH
jgi:hemoglobin